jgi:uncharacterized protein YbjT (DUF2867 family)
VFGESVSNLLTGPEAITYERVAADLSAATGREVRFVEVSDDVARQGILEAGLPDFVAEQLIRVYRQLRQGLAEQVTDTVEALTGRAGARVPATGRGWPPGYRCRPGRRSPPRPRSVRAS